MSELVLTCERRIVTEDGDGLHIVPQAMILVTIRDGDSDHTVTLTPSDAGVVAKALAALAESREAPSYAPFGIANIALSDLARTPTHV